MLLLSPTRAALALGTQCATPSGVGEEALLEALRLLTSRVEGALNVRTLSAVDCEDLFRAPMAAAERTLPFRLTNGFVDSDSVVVRNAYDSSGTAITKPYRVNAEEGTVMLTSGGAFYGNSNSDPIIIEYSSGFQLPAAGASNPDVHADPNYRVAKDVPDWLSSIAYDFLVLWQRNKLQVPKVTKEYGFLPTLNEALIRDLHGLIYNRYQRPRAMHHWSTSYAEI